MEQATITITEAITGLIEAGGPAAMWGLVIYMGFSVLKTAIVAGAWIWVILAILSRLSNTLVAYWEQDTKAISLLSEDLSNSLHSHLTGWDDRLARSYRDLQEEVGKLRMELERSRGKSETSADPSIGTTGESESDD